MRISLVTILLIAAGACSTAPSAGPAPAPAPARASYAAHPGFDLSRYPGDGALRAWRDAGPYEWVGFYLPAPCHLDPSWSGKRPTIQAMGYGFAVLYVGQQQFEGDTTTAAPGTIILCSRMLLTPERGRVDGADAAAHTAAEGFAPGTAIFLDVERFDRLTPEMSAYVAAWMDAVRADGRFRPALYAHRDNAEALRAIAPSAAAFWVAGGPGFAIERTPADSGFPFATAWQGLPAPRTWGGVTLAVDENVASTASPSAP